MIQPQYAQQYPQATPTANAVNIQIFEPKAYASPQPAMQPDYTNQFYSYPQASLYNAQQPVQYPQYMPMQYPQYVPQYMPQQAPVYTVPPQIVTSPQVQQMPAPVIDQNVQTQPVAPQEQAPTPAPAEAAPAVEVQQPATPAETVNVQELIAGLQNADPKVVEQTITKIADLSQAEPAKAQQVMNEQIMSGLASIVGADNSQLAGPTAEQVAALNKAAKGEQLTAEENQLVQQKSPKTLADSNKIIAMFTLAMLQKNQRDELDAYIAAQGANNNIAPLGTDNLIGFKEIQNAIQTDSNPEVRLAGIQAVSYVARPEDTLTVQATLQNSLKDPEPLIQQAAQEVLNKFGAIVQPAQTEQAPANVQQAA